MVTSGELYTDGGARGNPGPAGIGGVVNYVNSEGNKVQKKFKEYIGEATNNQAEYQALLKGLHLAGELGIRELSVKMDSELIVKQLRGEYKVKNPDLKPLFAEALKLTNKFANVTFNHVRREKNREADSLVNQALDGEFNGSDFGNYH